MKRTIRLSRAVILLALLLLAVSTVGASGPPRAIIVCQGCIDFYQESTTQYNATVKQDAAIKLIADAADLAYQSVSWRTNGVPVGNTKEISITVKTSAQYSLTVSDTGGIDGSVRSDTRIIRINLAAATPQNIGVPELADIAVDSDYLNRIVFSAGDRFKIKTDYDPNKYPGTIFSWIVDGGSLSGLIIENPSAKETRVFVKAKPSSGKNPVIRARIVNGDMGREKNVTIMIVDNTPPTVKGRYDFGAPLSYTEAEVSCVNCLTGAGGNENGDFISWFYVAVKDLSGKIISSGTASAKRGERLSSVTVKPRAEGYYTIEIIAKDSHGLSSSVTDLFPVGFGNTDEDVPFIIVNETIFGVAGKPVSIDVSKTNAHNLGTSTRFEDIIDITNPAKSRTEPLFNIYSKAQCRTFNCTTVFKYPGKHLVKITMAYIRNGKVSDKHSEKIVTVIIREAGMQVPVQAPQAVKPVLVPPAPAAKLTPQPPPKVAAKPTPGVNHSAVFAAIIAAAIFSQRKSKH